MYDFAHVRWAQDALWAEVRDHLRRHGVPAPEHLSYGEDVAWHDPDLVLSQTCGVPLVQELWGKVRVLGSFDYGLDGAPGSYYARIVVRQGDEAGTLEDLQGRRCGVNSEDSYSGFHALPAGLRPEGALKVLTGSHEGSMAAVLAGCADYAAVDAVSWRLSLARSGLRVLASTAPMPGLPLITAVRWERRVPALRCALAAGLERCPEAVRSVLGLRGFVPRDDSDYKETYGYLHGVQARMGN